MDQLLQNQNHDKEIPNVLLTDLAYMINLSKELEKDIVSPTNEQTINFNILQNHNSDTIKNFNSNSLNQNRDENQIINIENEIEKINEDNIELTNEIKNLTQAILNFEQNNGFNSDFHDEIMRKLSKNQKINKMNLDISNKIYDLYTNKFYLDSYFLWKIYGFKQLIQISPEENFAIFQHLTKIMDNYYQIRNILKNIEGYDFFSENDIHFNKGLGLNLKENEINNNKLLLQNISHRIKNLLLVNNINIKK